MNSNLHCFVTLVHRSDQFCGFLNSLSLLFLVGLDYTMDNNPNRLSARGYSDKRRSSVNDVADILLADPRRSARSLKKGSQVLSPNKLSSNTLQVGPTRNTRSAISLQVRIKSKINLREQLYIDDDCHRA